MGWVAAPGRGRAPRALRAGTVAVSGCRAAGIRPRPPVAAVGVEAGLPQVDEVTGDVRVGHEGVLEVVLRVRRAGLAQVLRDRAQDDDLTPGELRGRTSRLKPSDSARPSQTAETAPSKR